MAKIYFAFQNVQWFPIPRVYCAFGPIFHQGRSIRIVCIGCIDVQVHFQRGKKMGVKILGKIRTFLLRVAAT